VPTLRGVSLRRQAHPARCALYKADTLPITQAQATAPCIFCVAITGSVPTKAANAAVPITIAEQIESTQEAFEAPSNAALVRRTVDLCQIPGRPVATWQQARALLGLRAAA